MTLNVRPGSIGLALLFIVVGVVLAEVANHELAERDYFCNAYGYRPTSLLDELIGPRRR